MVRLKMISTKKDREEDTIAMSTPFGTPSFGQPAPGGSSTSTAADPTNGAVTTTPSEVVQEVIDENDPRLTSEAQDVNPEGDAFASPAPPPDRIWRAKLKLEGFKDAQGQVRPYGVNQTKKSPVIPYFVTGISAQIIDPTGKFDGITVYPPFGGMIGTLLNRDNTHKVATLLARVNKPDGTPWAGKGVKLNQRDWMELLVRALSGEPEVGIETQWQGSCQTCSEIAKKSNGAVAYPPTTQGMLHFPPEIDARKRKDGQLYSPESPCMVGIMPGMKFGPHGFFRARAVIQRFLALSEIPK